MAGSSVQIEIPQPQFHRVKNPARRKQFEDMHNNVNIKRPGERNRHVKIDSERVDLYWPESEVASRISQAMEVKPLRADYDMTEKMIDGIMERNQTKETEDGIFTSTLERYINSVGRKLPMDSHGHFFKDHYEKEVKGRGGILGGRSTNSIIEKSGFRTARESGPEISMTEQDGSSTKMPPNLNQNSGILHSQTDMSHQNSNKDSQPVQLVNIASDLRVNYMFQQDTGIRNSPDARESIQGGRKFQSQAHIS